MTTASVLLTYNFVSGDTWVREYKVLRNDETKTWLVQFTDLTEGAEPDQKIIFSAADNIYGDSEASWNRITRLLEQFVGSMVIWSGWKATPVVDNVAMAKRMARVSAN